MGRFPRLSLGLLLLFLLAALVGGAVGPVQAAPADPAAAPAGVLGIPLGKEAKIDAVCDDYGDGVAQTFADAGGVQSSVFLKHDGTYIYVCIKATKGSFKDTFGSLYLDPQGDGAGYVFAAQDDYSLRVPVPGASDSNASGTFNGTGVANGYVPNAALGAAWNGLGARGDGDTFEYRISAGRFFIEPCRIFGIAAYHHWVAAGGDDYGWPGNKWFDQPRTWQPAQLLSPACGDRSGKIAYVFRGNTLDATSFFNLLTGAGYSVTLVPLGNVLATDFTQFDLIIVADDTGNLSDWGTPADSAAQVTKISSANQPIIGLGEGGYAFFGKLSLQIGWPQGWHGPQDSVKRPAALATPHYNGPTPIVGDPVKVYTQAVNEVGIYLGAADTPLPGTQLVGLEPPSPDHASLIVERCNTLWGFSGNPLVMTGDGKSLFLNTVSYSRGFSRQCGTPPPPSSECFVEKSASPPAGTTVTPGQIIAYTIRYHNCTQNTGRLVDSVPQDTIFVPGSATDGIAPGADGALVWPVGPGETGSKSFKVRVSDTQCHNQRTVNNRAGLLLPDSAPIISNVVSHPVQCDPIVFPNDEPPYAEQEVQIHPYPLVTGTPSTISVRLINSSSTPQPVKVSFQTSPQRFGIGINFNTFDTRSVTIPANSSVIVKSVFTPVSSGHYCIQIKVESLTGQYKPIYTQRNLDVSEDLTPGKVDQLVFKVANPTASTANIQLVVVNTCPGWAALVAPALLNSVGPNGSDVRDATLSVTPPSSATELGSGCHIDVQGWIGDELIGGIRKLDVPPVHLPPDVTPPWMEPEISVVPDPPVAGQPGQICVEVMNPLLKQKQITLEFAVADFGAGIGFTPVATRVVTLAGQPVEKFCVDWTPATSGTTHRCIRVTLQQAGFQPLHSQRNVNIIRITPQVLISLRVPFLAGNPTLAEQPLELQVNPFGLLPFFEPYLVGADGAAPPTTLQPGQQVQLELRFRPRAGAAAAGATLAAETQQGGLPTTYGVGDESRVEVRMLLGGAEQSGFTVVLAGGQVFMPVAGK